MLLRASRNATELTKRAEEKTAILGRAAKAVGNSVRAAGQSVARGVKDPLGSLGKFVWKHKTPVVAGIAGTSAAAAGVAEGMRRASGGMEPPYPQAKAPRMYSF